MADTETANHLALVIDLRVDAAPGHDAFLATIAIDELGVAVQGTSADVVGAMQHAAERCAERLVELGYSVTSADILGALDVGPAHDTVADRVWN